MAAKSKSLQVIFNGVLSRAFPRAVAYALLTSRNGHMLGYEKTVEEALEPNKVPEEMIKPESDKYWSPNPQTGVFGPSSASATNTTDENCGGQEDSVLEEKAWFRQTSLEDLDKTHHS